MWYEILPSFGIIVAAMGIPHFSAYVFNKLLIGNAYRRQLLDNNQRQHYLRDSYLAGGDPYKVNSLEAIPDN